MKIIKWLPLLGVCVLVLFLSFLVSTLVRTVDAGANQDAPKPGELPPCKDPPIMPGSPVWQPNAKVKVVVNSKDFNSEELGAMRRAMDNWTKHNGPSGTNSGVTFGDFEFADQSPSVDTSKNTVYITKGEAPTGAQLYPRGNGIPPYMSLATMTIQCPLSVLEQQVAHELGHGFGLFDATAPYRVGETIMTGLQEGCRGPKGGPCLSSPTSCDLKVVRENFYRNQSGPSERDPGPAVPENPSPSPGDTGSVICVDRYAKVCREPLGCRFEIVGMDCYRF